MNNLDQNKKFFERWSESYDTHLFQFWMKRFQQPVINMVRGPGKMLDVSCGTGELIRSLSRRGEIVKLYGIDLTKGMLEKAKRKVPEAHFSLADVHQLPFPNGRFDYVLSTEAFHHYEDQKRALKEMVRVLKSEGTIIVVDVNFFWRGMHWLFQKLEPGCTKICSKKEMRELFKKAGLRNITQRRNFMFAVMTMGEK